MPWKLNQNEYLKKFVTKSYSHDGHRLLELKQEYNSKILKIKYHRSCLEIEFIYQSRIKNRYLDKQWLKSAVNLIQQQTNRKDVKTSDGKVNRFL